MCFGLPLLIEVTEMLGENTELIPECPDGEEHVATDNKDNDFKQGLHKKMYFERKFSFENVHNDLEGAED